MKKFSNPILITCLSAALGLLCLLARLWLMKTGIDEKALVIGSHGGNIISWCLVGIFVALLVVAMVAKPEKYSFRAGALSGAGAAVLVPCMVLTLLAALSGTLAPLNIIFAVMAGVSALCGGCLAFFRFRGKRGWLALYLPGLLTLMLQFLFCFRIWGAEPELQRYFFSLTAQICVLLALFYRTGAECKMNRPRLYLLFSCAGIFFGFAAAPDTAPSYLYSLWACFLTLENLGMHVHRRKSNEAA